MSKKKHRSKSGFPTHDFLRIAVAFGQYVEERYPPAYVGRGSRTRAYLAERKIRYGR